MINAVISDLRDSLGPKTIGMLAQPDADLRRYVRIALAAMASKRLRMCSVVVPWVVGVVRYTGVPDDLHAVIGVTWPGAEGWLRTQHPAAPRVGLELNGTRHFVLDTAPTALHLATSAALTVRYSGVHLLTDTMSTLSSPDLRLLVLRAQVECMRELSMRSEHMPAQTAGAAINGDYSLWQKLMREWELAA